MASRISKVAAKRPKNYIREYNRQIQSGKIETSEKVKIIYARLVKMLDSKAPFSLDDANRPIEFIERFCKSSKGEWAGKPIKLILWEKAAIQALYGFKDPKHKDRRLFKELFLLVGRKNGKSTLLSGLGLYMLTKDHEGGADVACVASKKDQARIVYDEAKHMVEQSPVLRKRIKLHRLDMSYERTYSTFSPLSSDSNTMDGLNLHAGIIDELHSIKDRNIYDVVRQSMTARRQPILFEITTAPIGNIEGSIYEAQYNYACQVVEGTVEDNKILPILYELDKTEEWIDESAWVKANPSLGVTKDKEELRRNVEKARVDASFRPTVLTKDFNVKAVSADTWLTWEELNNESTYELADLEDNYCIGGCDLSATTDLTCATLIIRRRNDGMIYVLQHYFLPQSRIDFLEATTSKEAPYKTWAERGMLTICPGTMVDYSAVTKWFLMMQQEHKLLMWKCGYDRALAGYWQQEMSDTFGKSVMEKVIQGPITWTAPMRELGAMLCDKQINYNNNPILKWCLSNTGVKATGSVEAIQPVKIQKNRRIDGMVSLLNAYTVYTKYKEDFLNLVG